MKKLLIIAIVVGCFSVSLAEEKDVILQVNDKKISKDQVETQLQLIAKDASVKDINALPPEMQKQILAKIASNVLLYEKAQEADIENNPEIREQIELIKKQIVINAFLEEKVAQMITEKEIKAEYDKITAEQSNNYEVRARHILVDSEEQAKQIIDELEAGGDFAELAAQYSKDPSNAQEGGDLGYFTKDVMVKEFSDAAFAIKEGELSKEPVQTTFGWHIVKVEDKRKVPMPEYSGEIKEKIKQGLMQMKAGEYVKSLIEDAKVYQIKEDGKKEKIDFGF